jgi:hypothetical protein
MRGQLAAIYNKAPRSTAVDSVAGVSKAHHRFSRNNTPPIAADAAIAGKIALTISRMARPIVREKTK